MPEGWVTPVSYIIYVWVTFYIIEMDQKETTEVSV